MTVLRFLVALPFRLVAAVAGVLAAVLLALSIAGIFAAELIGGDL